MTVVEIPWWKSAMGDAEAEEAKLAVAAAQVTMGPIVARLEREIAQALEVPYAVATPSGSAALVLSLMALGVRPGDEVIVPNQTFIATAHAALLLGARVVLADVRSDLPLLDVESVAKKITPRTRVIMAVHLNGRAVPMQPLVDLARQQRIHLVEDACQALFSRNRAGYLGTQSQVGCFSLGITKLISSGFGGIAATRDAQLYERMKLLRNQGLEDTLTCEYQQPGFNFKCSDVLAAIALVQLARKEEKIRHVNAIYARYEETLREFSFLQLLPVATSQGELPLYVQVTCPQRTKLMQYLKLQRIQSRRMPPDLAEAAYLAPAMATPTTRFAAEGLVLPCGPDQPLANVDRVIDALRGFV